LATLTIFDSKAWVRGWAWVVWVWVGFLGGVGVLTTTRATSITALAVFCVTPFRPLIRPPVHLCDGP
jgi:hypothetical protein